MTILEQWHEISPLLFYFAKNLKIDFDQKICYNIIVNKEGEKLFMGLDNGFRIRKDGKDICTLSTYRNFHALDRYMCSKCESIKDNYLFKVTEDVVEDLYREIQPFALAIGSLNDEELACVCDYGYERLKEAGYRVPLVAYSMSDFNCLDGSCHPYEISRLYSLLLTLKAGWFNFEYEGIEVVFYSSF